MTKQAELLLLQKTIESFGADSYLGPWLKSVQMEVTRDVQNDIFPSITMQEAAGRAQAHLDEATARGKEIIEAAKRQAEAIEKQATANAEIIAIRSRRKMDEHRETLAKAIQALHDIERV